MKVEHTHETVCDNNFVSEYVCVKKSVDLLSLFFWWYTYTSHKIYNFNGSVFCLDKLCLYPEDTILYGWMPLTSTGTDL